MVRTLFAVLIYLLPFCGSAQNYQNTQEQFEVSENPKTLKSVTKRKKGNFHKAVFVDTTTVFFNPHGTATNVRITGLGGKHQTYSYHPNGKLHVIVNYDHKGAVRFADSICYTAFDSISTVYRRFGENNYVLIYRYVYNDSHLSMKKEYLTSQDSIYKTISFYRTDSILEIDTDNDYFSSCSRETLDSSGKTIASEHFRLMDGHYLTRYFSYDSEGRLIKESYEDHWPADNFTGSYVRSGAVGENRIFQYDSVGRMVLKIENPYENWQTSFHFVYDKNGLLGKQIETTSNTASSEVTFQAVSKFKYDNQNNLKKVRKKIIGAPNWTSRYKYDSHNNWIKFVKKGREKDRTRVKTKIQRTISYY